MACICVLGMHRSGTSCLTGILQQVGVELGEVFTENLFNKRGNRENGRIVQLNDSLLNRNGGAWNDPRLVQEWTDAQAAERDAIVRELAGRSEDHWGFKDPRTLFTLPFWLEAVPDPVFIGTFRHPHRVALSLHHRDGSPLQAGWTLWRQYNLRLLELAQEHRFPLTDFDQPDELYIKDVTEKLVAIGLDPERAGRGRAFFDPALRNQAASPVEEIELPAEIRALYQDLLDYNSAS